MLARFSLILLLFPFSLLAADPKTLAVQAARGDANAIHALRAMGQPGVDALMAVRNDTKAFHAAIDAVCRQRDCAWSGLYWHTDLGAAIRAARQSRKPILSLRLLGNLDEELSCANSRYFRTLLYSNREISAYLRANYVLHWQPVRSAPRITIDFGDGRRMQRTITGNSIHYVLDANGEVLDAITAERRRSISPIASANEYAKTREKRLAAWTSGNLAPSKSGVEAPMFDRISFGARAQGAIADLAAQIRNSVAGPSTIDDNAKALIRAKRLASPDRSMRSEASLKKALEQLEATLAADTRINEERLHRQLHEWFRREEVTDVESLNDRVYRELFRAPNDDPWMGLVATSAITGITGEGLVVARK